MLAIELIGLAGVPAANRGTEPAKLKRLVRGELDLDRDESAGKGSRLARTRRPTASRWTCSGTWRTSALHVRKVVTADCTLDASYSSGWSHWAGHPPRLATCRTQTCLGRPLDRGTGPATGESQEIFFSHPLSFGVMYIGRACHGMGFIS